MTSSTTRPQVTAPSDAGAHGYPFGLTLEDLDAHGYRADEYFLEGEATRYRPAPGTELGVDGRWSAEPSGTGALPDTRPRVPARRPGPVQRHGGAALEQRHRRLRPVLGRHARDARRRLRVRRRHDPAGRGPRPARPRRRACRHGTPSAYGTLSIASDDDSYDIFTQAARAVGPDRDRTTDPLGGLDVERVIAMGSSQSAGRLGHLRQRHPSAGPRHRRVPAAHLLRQRHAAGGRRRGGQHRQPDRAVRRPRRAAGPEPAPRRPRRAGDGRQLRARGHLLPARCASPTPTASATGRRRARATSPSRRWTCGRRSTSATSARRCRCRRTSTTSR